MYIEPSDLRGIKKFTLGERIIFLVVDLKKHDGPTERRVITERDLSSPLCFRLWASEFSDAFIYGSRELTPLRERLMAEANVFQLEYLGNIITGSPYTTPTPTALDGLKHALNLVRGRRTLNRTKAYLAAIDELEIFLMAAIERVMNGESMNSNNVTTGVALPIQTKENSIEDSID
jgi:hypothetical protein